MPDSAETAEAEVERLRQIVAEKDFDIRKIGHERNDAMREAEAAESRATRARQDALEEARDEQCPWCARGLPLRGTDHVMSTDIEGESLVTECLALGARALIDGDAMGTAPEEEPTEGLCEKCGSPSEYRLCAACDPSASWHRKVAGTAPVEEPRYCKACDGWHRKRTLCRTGTAPKAEPGDDECRDPEECGRGGYNCGCMAGAYGKRAGDSEPTR